MDLSGDVCKTLENMTDMLNGEATEPTTLSLSDPNYIIDVCWTRCEGEKSILDRNLEATIDFAGLGVSIIDSQPKELMYISMQGLDLEYSDGDDQQTLLLNLKWFQLDNQVSEHHIVSCEA